MNTINPGMTPPISGGGDTKAQGGVSAQDAAKLREAAADFEAMFVKQMLSSMRKAIPREEGGLIKESEGEKIFRDLLDAEYAKTASRTGQGMGVGAAMYRQLMARYGVHAQPGGNHQAQVPTLGETRQAVEQLRRDHDQFGAAGHGRVGPTGTR